MKISNKFLFINFLIAILILSISLSIFLIIDYRYQKDNIIKQLMNLNKTINESVDVYINALIENYLKSIADKNNTYIGKILKEYNDGQISVNDAKTKIKNYLKNIKIGKTGYVFIWNIKEAPDKIILDLHPEIEKEDVAYVDFVQTGVKLKNGYLEYLWGNPSDKSTRYKSMYLQYIKELDWIIAYSSYKEEFYFLFDIDKFRNLILGIRNFGNGNSFIIDYDGNIVIHPYLSGNFSNVKDIKGKYFIKEILEKKEGVITYYWPINGENNSLKNKKEYKKIAYYSPIEKFKLIVISTVYENHVFSYYYKIIKLALIILFIFIFLIFFITIKITNILLKPIYILNEKINEILKNYPSNEIINLEKFTIYKNENEIVSFSKFIEKIMDDINKINLKLKDEYNKEKKLKEEYENQKLFISKIIDLLPFAICVIDIENRILNYNSYFYKNYTSNKIKEENSDIINKKINEVIYFSGIEDIEKIISFKEIVEETKLKKIIIENKIKFLDDKNKQKVLKIYSIPFFESNILKYIIIKIDDLTDEESKIQKDIEIQKIQTINNIVKGISHDVNNFIGAINGGAKLLDSQIDKDIETIDNIMLNLKNNSNINKENQNGREKIDFIYENLINTLEAIRQNLNSEYKYDIQVIFDSTKKALNLLQKFNVLNRKKDEEFKSLDLKDILSRIYTILKSSFAKNIVFEFYYEENEDYYILGIEEQIESLIMNIIINAYHALIYREDDEKLNEDKENKISLKLQKIIKDEKKYIEVIIEDNGMGIPEEIKDKIFEPFFTTKPLDKGSGIGLYLVKQIVENHKANIYFDSKVGAGTTFYIEFLEL